MSQIYIKEPPTNGKVLLKTTLGDMDIELWSKEAPLACRNFVQLCMEGYYNGIMFHRIIPDFIAQGGDPTGTGEGGESIYGHTFKDEFHSRLKFNRRGLVGMANGGRDDNSSQFFITLNRADELTNKHTLFGKVTGDTLYNMIRLNEVHSDADGRPRDPIPKIIKAKVLSNPFDDITPRIDTRKLEKRVEKPKSQSKATKNFGLLSFGEEAEDDEEKINVASKDLKIKSSHDVLTDDPKLSAEPALDVPHRPPKEKKRERKKRKREEDAVEGSSMEVEGKGSGEEEDQFDRDGQFDRRMKEEVKRKLGHVDLTLEEELDMEDNQVAIKTEQLRQESKQLKRELKESQRKREEEERRREREEREREAVPEVVKAMRRERMEYKRRKDLLKGGNREQNTLELLSKFKSHLLSARSENDAKQKEVTPIQASAGEQLEEEGEEESSKPQIWLHHQITFKDDEDRVVLAKDANVQNEDTFDIYDPRNPLNMRRRGEGEGTSKSSARGGRGASRGRTIN